MHLNKWRLRLAMALVFMGALACRTADVFIAQATVTPTRSPKPTFTAAPKPTDTSAPLPTSTQASLPPIAAPLPTKAPTKAPTRAPTRAPTPVPIPPTAVIPPTVLPSPTFLPVEFGQETRACIFADTQTIQGKVYTSRNSGATGLPGQMIALGGPDGSNVWQKVRNEDSGAYKFTITGAEPGTYYIWMYDSGSGRRISDIGGPIKMNPVGADQAGTCWAGSVDFWKK